MRHLLGATGFTRIAINPLRNRYHLDYWLRLAPVPAGLKMRVVELARRSGAADIELSVDVGNLLCVAYRGDD